MSQVDAGIARALLGMLLLGAIAGAAPVTAQESYSIVATFSPELNDDGWSDGPVEVTLACEPACDFIEFALDGGEPVAYDAPFTLDDEGTYDLAVEGYVGESLVASGSFFVGVDGTPPDVDLLATCEDEGEAGWCLDAVSLAVAASDELSFVTLECTLDGRAIEDCPRVCLDCEQVLLQCEVECPRASWVVASDGVFEAEAVGTDAAGNSADDAETIKIDGTPPEIASVSCSTDWQAHGGWCAELLDLTPASDETSGIADSSCRIGDFTWPCDEAGPLDATGELVFFASATDAAGNVAEDDVGVGWMVDPDAPVATLDVGCEEPGAEGWCLAAATYLLDATDELSGIESIECALGGAEAACEGELLDAGVHELAIRAYDVAGNMVEESFEVGIDLAPPEVSILTTCDVEGTQEESCVAGLALDIDASDDASTPEIACWVDDGEPGECPPELPLGAHVAHVRATDAAGRTAEDEVAYLLEADLAPPLVSLVLLDGEAELLDDGWYLDWVDLEIVASDAASGLDRVEWRMDGGFWEEGDGIWTEEGAHTYQARAFDAAGNVAYTDSLLVRIDTGDVEVLDEWETPIRPGDDTGLTTITFAFNVPMDQESTVAALLDEEGEPLTGWDLSWGDDDLWLNLTRSDLEEGSEVEVALGPSAAGRHGGTLGYTEYRETIARGAHEYTLGHVAYDFVNITEEGADAAIYCDDCGRSVALPFPFTFFGETYETAYLSSNGFLTFDNMCLGEYSPDPFPDTCARNLVAAYWEDLDTRPALQDPPQDDRILTMTVGEAPERVFLVSWSVVHHYYQAEPVSTFQIKLFEGTNDIEVHYESALPDDGPHLAGVINRNGTRHLTYMYAPAELVGVGLSYTGGTPVRATPPSLDWTLTPAANELGWHTEPVTLEILTDEDATTSASIDGGEFVEGASFELLADAADGTVHTVRVRATDGEGATATSPTFAVKVDATAPTVAIEGASDGGVGRFTLAFSEPMDTASVEAALTGADGWLAQWSEDLATLTLTMEELAFGTHVLSLGTTATDAHGVALAEAAEAELTRSRPSSSDDSGDRGFVVVDPAPPATGEPFTVVEETPPAEPLVEEPVAEEPVVEAEPEPVVEPEAEPEPESGSSGDEGDLEPTSTRGSTTGGGRGGDDGRDTPNVGVAETIEQTSFEEESTQERAPEPEIVFDVPVGAGARGTITFRLTGIDRIEEVSVVLVDGETRTILATGLDVVEWDTTSVPDGMYRILVIRTTPDPEPGELAVSAAEVELASKDVLVRNEFSAPAVAAGAAVAGVLAVAGAQAGASALTSGASSAMSSAGGGFDAFGFAQEVAGDVAEDKIRDKRGQKEAALLERRRQMRSAFVAVVSFALLAGLWAFSQMQSWTFAEWLRAVPVIGLAAVIVMALKYTSESVLAHATGAKARVRLLISGAIALAFSSIVLRNPFGYPGYVDEVGESEAKSTWRIQGLRALAVIAGAAAFMIPFLAIATVAPWGFVSVGVLLAVTNVATTAMPFGPLPGRDVWRWNKALSVGVAVACLGLYVGFAAALVPLWALWAIGLAGGAAYVAALVHFRRLRKAKERTVRVPVAVPVPVKVEEGQTRVERVEKK